MRYSSCCSIALVVAFAALIFAPSNVSAATADLINLTQPEPDSVLLTYVGPDATSVLWNFGDGIGARGESAYHRYNHSGNYTVSVQVVLQPGNPPIYDYATVNVVVGANGDAPRDSWTLWNALAISFGTFMIFTGFVLRRESIAKLSASNRIGLGCVLLVIGWLSLSGVIP